MPQYEDISAENFGGDTVAAEIARNDMRRAEGNKLVHPPIRIKEYERQQREKLLSEQFADYVNQLARPD